MKGCIVKIGDFLPVGGIEEYCRIIQKESKKIGIDLDIISIDIGAKKNEIKERELMNGVKYTVYNIHNIDEFRNKLDEYESIILINSYVTTLTDIKTPESKIVYLKNVMLSMNATEMQKLLIKYTKTILESKDIQ